MKELKDAIPNMVWHKGRVVDSVRKSPRKG